MSAKRKDKKGRVLRTGESQRKDLTYQYRYQDITGKRRTVYAPTLEELRAKEEEINNAVNEHHFQWALKKYRKLHPDQPLPKITPHVFRRTFCTKMAHAGMDIKSLQYLMGHSDAGVTMNVYTHATYDHAEATMQKILRPSLPEGERKSG